MTARENVYMKQHIWGGYFSPALLAWTDKEGYPTYTLSWRYAHLGSIK